MRALWRKIRWAGIVLTQRITGQDPVTGLKIVRIPSRRLGCRGGAWRVPCAALREGMRVVSAGVGQETSFEERLMRLTGAEVQAFDPTPVAAAHAETVRRTFPGFRFHPLGLWEEEGERLFYAPRNPEHVSHSLVGLNGDSPAFTARCLNWKALLRHCGWERADLLKMDIEGAEYAVLRNVLSEGPLPPVICLEFDETHSPMDAQWRRRIRESADLLLRAGYRLAGVIPKGNYTFVREKRQ